MAELSEQVALVDELIDAAKLVEWTDHFGSKRDMTREALQVARANVLAALQHPVASSEALTADQQDDWAKPLLRERSDRAAPMLGRLYNPDGPAAVAKLRPVVELLKWDRKRWNEVAKADLSMKAHAQNSIDAIDRALADLGERV